MFIADRKEAIRAAVTLSPAGSVILLAGKGHETYQIIGTEVYTNGEAIYCEECQRYLLKTYGCRGALEEWENRKIDILRILSTCRVSMKDL